MIVAATLPDNAGYVVAAYLVFLGLILIYVAIMAVKLARLERDVVELNALADRAPADASDDGDADGTPGLVPTARDTHE